MSWGWSNWSNWSNWNNWTNVQQGSLQFDFNTPAIGISANEQQAVDLTSSVNWLHTPYTRSNVYGVISTDPHYAFDLKVSVNQADIYDQLNVNLQETEFTESGNQIYLNGNLFATISGRNTSEITVTVSANYRTAYSQVAKLFDGIYYLNTAEKPPESRTITFVVSESDGTPSQKAVTVQITEINDLPIALADAGVTDQDTPVTVDVVANDVDLDDTIMATVSSVSAGSATAQNGREIVFDPGQAFKYLAAGVSADAVVTYQVTDGRGGVSTETLTITVGGVNDAPILAAPLADQIIAEDTAWSFTVPAGAFTDVDNSSLSYSATLVSGAAMPGWLTFNPATRVFSGTPPLNFNGTISLKIVANDGQLSASDIFDLAITPVNDAPTGTNAALTMLQDAARTLGAADFGFSDVDAHSLSAVRIATLPSAGTLQLDGAAVTAGQNVSAADLTAGRLIFAPTPNASGASYASLTFQVQDNGGTANGGVDLDQTPKTLTFDVVDTVGPTLNIATSDALVNGTETALVTITASEAVTGLTASDVTVVGGTIGDLESADNKVFTTTFTPSPTTSGPASLTIAAATYTDVAGNAGTGDSEAFAVDTVGPTLSIATSDALVNGTETALVTITASEAVTGLTATDVTVVGGTIGDLESADNKVFTTTFTPTPGSLGSADDKGSTTTFTSTPGFSGQASLSIEADSYTDVAGNQGAGGSESFTVDAEAPTLTIATSDTLVNGTETALVTITASEAVTGLTASDVTVVGGTIGDLESADNITFTTVFTPTPNQVGPASLAIAGGSYTDPAGNLGGAAELSFLVQGAVVGTGGDEQLYGGPGADRLDGGDGADTLNGGQGADLLTGGAGPDVFAGTAAELNGDRITDYEAGEAIFVQGPQFTADDVALAQGSTIISVDTDQDGTPDLTVTLDLDLPDLLAMNLLLKVTQTPDGTEISFVPAPSLDIAATVASQRESVPAYSFTVIRTGEVFAASSATWTLTSADADGADFGGGGLPSGIITFAPNELSQTITLDIAGDTVIEADEAFTITLSDPVGAVIATATVEGMIVNDDSSFSITANAPGLLEGDTGLTLHTFTVTRSGDTSTEASVVYSSSDETAYAADYVSVLGLLTFAPGDTTQTFSVYTIGDQVVEADETFSVSITSLDGDFTTGADTATGLILNDDVATYSIAAGTPSVTEGNSGQTPYSFVVTSTAIVTQDVVLDWVLTHLTTSSSDVLQSTGQVVMRAYETTATITVNIQGDTQIEADESFTITLLDPNLPNTDLGTATATGVIENDDFAPPAPSVPDLLAASDLGASNSDDLTADATPTLTGSAAIGSTVTLWDGTTEVGTGVAVDGTWSITTIPLAEGTREITATATLDGFTSEASAPLLITLDATAPTLTIAVDDPVLSAGETGILAFTASEALTGLTAANLTVTGGTIGALTTTDSITFTAGFTPEAGFEGQARVAVKAGSFTDLAGNAGSAVSIDFEGAPLPDRSGTPFGPNADGFTFVNAYVVDGDTDYPGTGYDSVQQGTRVGFNGQQSPMEILRGSDFDFLGGSFAAGFGSVTLTISGYDDGALRGAQSISLSTGIASSFVADSAIFTSVDRLLFTVTGDTPGYWVSAPMDELRFNIAPELLFDVDSVAPTLSIAVSDALVGETETALVTLTASEAVTGLTATDVAVTGGAIGALTTSDNVTFTATFTPTANTSGPASLTVAAGSYADVAGNAGGASSEGFAVDTVAPTITAPDLLSSNDTGVSNTDNLTYRSFPVFSGFADQQEQIELLLDGTPLDAHFGFSTANPSYFGVSSNVMILDGMHAFALRATDAAGNVTTSDSLIITIDTAAPTLSIAVSDALVGGTETALVTLTASEAVAGLTADDLVVTGGAIGALVTTDNITFTTSFTPAVNFAGPASISIAEGSYSDLAGNAGQTASLIFAVDAEAPDAPVIGAISTDTDIPGDFVTSDRTLTFTGAAEEGSTVTLALGGTTLGTVLAVDGSWSFDHSATVLPLGDLLLTAQATDAAGNASDIDSQTIRIFAGAVVTPCLTSWGQHYEGSLGNDSFCISGSDNSVTSGYGDDLIRMQGWNNLIDAGVGNDTIQAGQGQARVDAGSGDNIIRLEGWNNSVVAGDGDNIVERPAGNSNVTLGDGEALVTMDGWTNQVTIGDTPDGDRSVIQAGQGNSAVTAGDGALEVALGGWSNRIEAGQGPLTASGTQGNSTVQSGGGPTSIIMGGWGNQIAVGATGPHVIDAGMGNARVTVAGGDATITARGWNNDIRTHDGDDDISGLEGSSFVWAGDGDNRVTASGWWNQIETGSGADRIIAGAGGALVKAGGGNDEIRVAGWHNRVEAGAGDDTIHSGDGGDTFVLNDAGDGVDQIFDFGVAMGDKLEFRGVSSGQVSVQAVGEDLSVTVGATQVALLMDQGDLTLEELLARGSLLFA